jgi:hypothetical protein
LRSWLDANGFEFKDNLKPARPKEALEAALRAVRKARSSSIYRELAERVSIKRCRDMAFIKLRDKLNRWFPKATR